MKKSILLLIISTLYSCAYRNQAHEHSLDAHMHIHPTDGTDDMEFHASRALFAASSIGIQRAIVLSGAYSKMAYKDFTRTQNHFVANEVKKQPQKLAGACAVNPMMDWAQEEMVRCRHEGLEVLKLHTVASGMDLRQADDKKNLREILRKAQDLHFTVLIHGHFPREGEAIELLAILKDYDKTRLILGHGMGRNFEFLRDFKHPNFFVELSIAPIWTKTKEEKEKLVAVIRDVGIDKFLFGSDWPVIHPAETLKAINELPLTDSEKDQIVYTNSEALDDLFK